MDRNFHTDEFERLLREKSDEFRMYPSRRIWHSIYNNIHPGHKWPSVATCITLISALLLVGYLNTRNTNSYSGINKTDISNQTAGFIKTKTAQFVPPTITVDVTSNTAPLTKNISEKKIRFKKIRSTGNSRATKTILDFALPFTQQISNVETRLSLSNITAKNYLLKIDPNSKRSNRQLVHNNASFNDVEINISIDAKKDSETITVTNYEEPKSVNQSATTAIGAMALNSLDHAVVVDFDSYSNQEVNNLNAGNKAVIGVENIISQVEQMKLATDKNNIINTDDENWIDNYALYNRPVPKKWTNKLDWQVYATPGVVYRTLHNISTFGNTLNATPFAISSSGQNINSSVIQTPSLGFEVGIGLKYLILKNVKIKGAFQLNFTRYNAHAFENSHPVATKLTMHNFETKTSYEVQRSTAYSNNSGLESVKLHNETFQISLPVGVDLKLIGNERLQWNVGASIQPTFVAGGKSYLISSDRHNYVKEASMLSRWNLNAGFETFISFKSNGLTWQVGPQFRKQLFSTNSKTFAVEEKLVNYGIKFGVSKTLK